MSSHIPKFRLPPNHLKEGASPGFGAVRTKRVQEACRSDSRHHKHIGATITTTVWLRRSSFKREGFDWVLMLSQGILPVVELCSISSIPRIGSKWRLREGVIRSGITSIGECGEGTPTAVGECKIRRSGFQGGVYGFHFWGAVRWGVLSPAWSTQVQPILPQGSGSNRQ